MQCQLHFQSPYRLVVRTSRCGSDNPGSTPGEDIYAALHGRSVAQYAEARRENCKNLGRDDIKAHLAWLTKDKASHCGWKTGRRA